MIQLIGGIEASFIKIKAPAQIVQLEKLEHVFNFYFFIF